ncbi:MAG TPA: hypothetical protein VF914_10855 [Chloroflexia bacterium]|jgi:hypothetical protein
MVSKNKSNGAGSKGKQRADEGEDPRPLQLLSELDDIDEEYRPLAEVVSKVQEEATAGQAPLLGKKDNSKNIIVRVNGFRFRRSERGELLGAFPCTTCWREVWKVVDGTLNILEYEIMTGIWDQVGSYCSYCAPLAGEGLGRSAIYARQSFELGTTMGQILQEKPESKAFVVETADSMHDFLDCIWGKELERHVRLQRASFGEQREARALFYENFEQGVKVGIGLQA